MTVTKIIHLRSNTQKRFTKKSRRFGTKRKKTCKTKENGRTKESLYKDG
ncbi:MAG: hypothetical protein K0S33_3945 [Bacteroidetes bacterium]|jgi:hypothetical protein|nr:hypothetical protein [Bacteroidota bacterium]